MNRFSKICLLFIALSLGIIALRPVVWPQPARAANHFKYLLVTTNWQAETIQAELDKRASEGWELASSYSSGQGATVDLVFRQDAR